MPLPGALIQQPVLDSGTGLITRPWLLWLNSLSSAGGGSAAAPANAQFVTYAANAVLTAARVATTSADISIDLSSANLIRWLLTTTGVSAGTYGDATHVPRFTVDVNGRITAASNVPITAGTQAWVPMTTGAIPGEILFIGGDVMLQLTSVP